MSQELKQLILSYPTDYSAKEIYHVLLAETGECVQETLIAEIRSQNV